MCIRQLIVDHLKSLLGDNYTVVCWCDPYNLTDKIDGMTVSTQIDRMVYLACDLYFSEQGLEIIDVFEDDKEIGIMNPDFFSLIVKDVKSRAEREIKEGEGEAIKL